MASSCARCCAACPVTPPPAPRAPTDGVAASAAACSTGRAACGCGAPTPAGTRTRRTCPVPAAGARPCPASPRSVASTMWSRGASSAPSAPTGTAPRPSRGGAAPRRSCPGSTRRCRGSSLGDLNATAGTPAVARLVAGGLRDTLAQLGERGPQAATHHAWDGSTERHAHRLRAGHGRVARARRPPSGTTVPAAACRPITGRWSPTCASLTRREAGGRRTRVTRGRRLGPCGAVSARRCRATRSVGAPPSRHRRATRSVSFCRSCRASSAPRACS